MLDFVYWFDQPGGGDGLLTENHQITYHGAEYLMGQRFPDTVFHGSGLTGAEHMEKVRPWLLRWLKDRARFGYSEWLSKTYYGIDVTPLVSLVDFAEDEEIANRAAIALDLLIYDLALNSYRGYLGSTQGRVPNTDNLFENPSGIISTMMPILFGVGGYRGTNETAGTAIATGTYGPPHVIAEIARDAHTFTNRQRNGIFVMEGPLYGYGYETDEDAVFWYGMGAWSHPLVVPLTIRFGLETGVFPIHFPVNDLVDALWPEARASGGGLLVTLLAALVRPIAAGSVYDRANIITHRTPYGTLSSAQDKMKGQMGFQQHAWQAMLGPEAVVFTTHPGPLSDSKSSGTEWLGGSSMPRVGQHENVAVILYDAAIRTLYGGLIADLFPDYTHAYFPQDQFDEVVTEGNWVFGRKGDGYVALYSDAPITWTTEGDFARREITAPGMRNAWICEIGDLSTHGTFEEFIEVIASAPINVSGADVFYESPSQGPITFDWEGPLVVNGIERDLGPHMRYDNPFSTMRWGARRLSVERGDATLHLDFETGARTGS